MSPSYVSGGEYVPSPKPGYGLVVRKPSEALTGLLTCDTCGGFVANDRTDLHDTWHRTLGQQQGVIAPS